MRREGRFRPCARPWTRLNIQAAIFCAFALITFLSVGGVFLAVKPRRFEQIIGGRILINRQWVQLPIEPVLKLLGLAVALISAFVVGASMMSSWTTLALFWHAPQAAGTLDPIFGKPVGFYLFTLPAWQLISRLAAGIDRHRLPDSRPVRAGHSTRPQFD